MSDQPTPWPSQPSPVPPPPGPYGASTPVPPGPYGGPTPPPPYGAPPPPYGAPPSYGGGSGGVSGPLQPAKNGLATAALILGILGIPGFITLVIPLLALGLGLGGASKAKRSNGAIGGAGKAKAGWILGLLGTLGFVVTVVLVATGVIESDNKSVEDLDIAACYDLPLDSTLEDEISTLKEIPCDQPHDGQLFYQGTLNPDRDRDYPSTADALTQEAGTECVSGPFEDFTGESYDTSPLTIYVLIPSEEGWKPSRGKFSCFLVTADGSALTESKEAGGDSSTEDTSS